MMSGIATRKAAYDAVKQGSVVPLPSNFTADDFVQFKRGMAAVAKSVPSAIGGDYGHVYLLEDGTAYQQRTSKAIPTEVAAPASKPIFDANATAAEIEQAKFDHSADTEAYLTQEGCRQALVELIVDNVPADCIAELADYEYGFQNVEPKVLMKHLEDEANAADIEDVEALLEKRDAPLEFDGETSLRARFRQMKQCMKELEQHYKVQTSESNLIVVLLGQIERRGKEFEKNVTEWREAIETNGDTHNTWANFSVHFAEADRVRRRRLKLTKTAGDAGYHSANIVVDLERKLNEKLTDGMAAVALAADQTILQLMEHHGGKQSSTEKSSASNTSAPNDNTAALLALLTKMDKRLATLEGKSNSGSKSGGGGGDQNGGANQKTNGGTDQKASKFKYCKNCGRKHVAPEADCLNLEENAAKRPEGFVVRFGYGGKGTK
jgi:hypothetical protein